MSRTLRMVLDFALGSVTKARPVISQAWDTTKVYVAKTRAKRLICNSVVNKIEEKVNQFTELLITKMTTLRNNQLPKEAEYLQKELDNIKQQIEKANLNKESSCKEHSFASKNLKKAGSISWQYIKVEAVPPLTIGFFNGPSGKKLEESAEKIADTLINMIAGQIKTIDEEAERKIREKEAAIKAQIEKQIAEEKKKADERKAAAEAAAKKAAEAVKQAAAAKAAEEASKSKEKEKQNETKSNEQKTANTKKSEPKKG